jgi:hypothetical protein
MATHSHHSNADEIQEEDKAKGAVEKIERGRSRDFEDLISKEWKLTDLSIKQYEEQKTSFWTKRFVNLNKFDLSQSLALHTLKPHDRAWMVEWLIEVQNKLGCSMLTYFKAVGIMDLYYKVSKQ